MELLWRLSLARSQRNFRMLFNSPLFLYGFLPATLCLFWIAHIRLGVRAAQWVLLTASCVFYGAWDWHYLAMLLVLLAINFQLGGLLARRPSVAALSGGIAFNLLVLGYFKYTDFFIGNLNAVTGTQYPLLHVILPLGMSFFIFQKIAYLVDCHKGLVIDRDPLRFSIFVMFFPQLIAGPIVHHTEIIPQLQKSNLLPDAKKVSVGLFLLVTGLFKKVIVADWLSEYVDAPFAHVAELQFMDAWTAALGYSLQLYFDFSAYSEMAMGLALLFGVLLPVNFNSPYQSANIAEFWRRWHITLGRFLRDYLYIPLGGSRNGWGRAMLAALIVMTLGGLWHGAGWTFILWGLMHGTYLTAHRAWGFTGIKLSRAFSVGITFLAVLFAWVMFRATSVADALTIWQTMLGMNGIVLPSAYAAWFDSAHQFQHSPFINGIEVVTMFGLLIFCMSTPNTPYRAATMIASTTWRSAALVSIMVATSILALSHPTTFLYYQF